MDTSLVGKFVMPGDVVLQLQLGAEKIVIGPGLRRVSEKVVSTKCGILRCLNSKTFFVENHQKRYVPVLREDVIGIVLKKNVDTVFVDIGANEPACLSLLAFEGATKRNKPSIKVGDLVYGKVTVACKDMEPELVCINSYGKSNGLGKLDDGGYMITVPLEVCRRLLSPDMKILKRLGTSIPFEVAVGLNGRIWVKGNTLNQTVILIQAISMIEHATEDEACEIFDSMFENINL